MFKYIFIITSIIISINIYAKDISYIDYVENFTKENNINLVISPNIKDFEMAQYGDDIKGKNNIYKLITMLGTQNSISVIVDEQKKSIYLESARAVKYRDLPLIKNENNLPSDYRFIRYLYKAKHMFPRSLARNMRPLLHRYGRITHNAVTGQILISDTAINVKKILKIFNVIDTPKTKKNEEMIRKMDKEFKEEAKTREGFLLVLSKHQILFVILFSLIFLIIGFLARGYMIKRIEGGF